MSTAKSIKEIRDAYMIKPQYDLNNCFSFYKEMHDNGHFDYVKNFLLNGDGVLGKQGYTYDAVLSAFAEVKSEEFNDYRGEYAGTHYTYFYNGEKVYERTSYSLFN